MALVRHAAMLLSPPRLQPEGRTVFSPLRRHRTRCTSPRSRPHARAEWASAGASADVAPVTPAIAVAAPARCAFSLAAEFMLAEPRPPKLSPLGERSVFAPPPAPPPSAHLWLAAGFPGQDRPGRLVSGLRRLTHAEEFLNVDPSLFSSELALKRAALADADRRRRVLVAEPGSLAAQAETLELFLDYLPRRYPEHYSVEGAREGRVVRLALTGEALAVADFAACPLELCARLVQEDLVLMRSPDGGSGGGYCVAAAAVVFSFAELSPKLGRPMAVVHAPVPGFERELDGLLAKAFNGLLADKRAPCAQQWARRGGACEPFAAHISSRFPRPPAFYKPRLPTRPAVWRNNWGLVETGQLDRPSFGSPDKEAPPGSPSLRWLKSEYQTLRRLPSTNAVLFTIRTFLEPVAVLAGVPGAAATLARSFDGLSPGMRAYKGLGKPDAQEAMLAHLRELAATADAPA